MTDRELQLRLLYAVIVAGKSAKFAEQAMVKLFAGLGGLPFHWIQTWFHNGCLDYRLRQAKVGNYGKVFKAFHEAAFSGLDLRICSPAELEAIHGIGPKTARFFLIWTRPDVRVAALDVHVLRWLRDLGYDAPRQTPSGRKYAELEAVFLVEAERRGLTPRELDEVVWSAGSNRDQGQIFESLTALVNGETDGRTTGSVEKDLPCQGGD
jgi:thermostable 8-oxoguanine DNA glycosylase